MSRPAFVLLLAAFASLPEPSAAQETLVWSDIDCSQTKIVVPAGLRCRETNTAGTRNAAKSTGGGLTKRWNAFGTVGQAKVFYYVHDDLAASHVQVGQTNRELRSLTPQGKDASNMSAPVQRAGVDFVTFASGKDSCIGFRKLGPSRQSGYAWVLWATRCVPAGQKASDADVDSFIAAANFRQ